MTQDILFFADRLPPLTGGVEMHARYFIEHFIQHSRFPISGIVTKDSEDRDCLVSEGGLCPIDIRKLPLLNPAFVFFNSGRWIEELELLRNLLPKATFIYRTGGNEIIKAPLIHRQIPDHASRQSYWAGILNRTIDLLVTNSAFTETRLQKIGVSCPFLRCVGGVNTSALQPSAPTQGPPIIFCAARFVPYKNHSLLLDVIRQLILRNYHFQVRLAGTGPLLKQMKEKAFQDVLAGVVEFLGDLDNTEVCREISHSQIYMQLSTDQLVEVPGGSYIHAEGMGRSILEAITAGTFVVSGRSGALSEIVTKDRGLLLDIGVPEQIADKIEQLLKSLPRRRPFFEGYSWETVFKRYENLMENIHAPIVSH